MEEKFYTINEVAEKLDMHHKTIRKLIKEGKLSASKVGKQWRISNHNLSSFLGESNTKQDSERKLEQNLHFTTEDNSLLDNMKKARINVSAVVDIDDIDHSQYMRISNTLIATMNAKDPDMQFATINMKYYQEESNLKVLLWGQVKFIEEMLSIITILVDSLMVSKNE